MKMKLRKIFFVILGTALLSLSSALFILPNNILTGGVAGISIILHPLLGGVSKDIIASFASVILFIVGTIFLGKEFALKTFLSTIVYSLFTILFTRYLKPVEVEPLLACLYGGIIGGVGVGIVFRQGGSTGGMDVPPLILNKYFNIDVSKGIFIIDTITVSAGLLEYNIETVLIGLISVYFTSIGVNKMITFGAISAKEIKIVSDKYELITEKILKLDRGVTLFKAYGGYTGEDKNVIMCIVSDNEYQTVLDIISEVDPRAFTVVTETKEVRGEGFSVPVRI